MSPTFPKTWPGLERDNADKSVRQYLKPAFPVLEQGPTGLVLSDCGMSLRDWFAGQALSGCITKPDAYSEHHNIAIEAYEIADAMMKARES